VFTSLYGASTVKASPRQSTNSPLKWDPQPPNLPFLDWSYASVQYACM
jgi:hypothetical protein